MEAALALLLPLVGGFLFLEAWSGTKFKTARDDGHRLYFKAGFAGAFLFLAALLVLLGLRWLLLAIDGYHSFESRIVAVVAPIIALKDRASAIGQIGFLLTCLVAMFLGPGLAKLLNWYRGADVELALWEAVSEDELEDLLLTALSLAKTILVTQTNGKVYVGLVLSTPEPRKDRRMLTLLPVMSGHRDASHQAQFTTFYEQIYSELDDVDKDEFRLVLPLDKCMSFSLFDIETFSRFSGDEPPTEEGKRGLPDIQLDLGGPKNDYLDTRPAESISL